MIYRFVADGGPFMLPILGASVVALALALERAWYWLGLRFSRDDSLRHRLLAGGEPPPGDAVADPVARVLVDAVRRPDDLGVAVARAERVLRESRASLGALRLVAGAAALGGLLGTAIGVRSALRAPVDARLAGTLLADAIHPTILGLGVFLLATVAAAVFHGLASALAAELDEHLDEIARSRRAHATLANHLQHVPRTTHAPTDPREGEGRPAETRAREARAHEHRASRDDGPDASSLAAALAAAEEPSS